MLARAGARRHRRRRRRPLSRPGVLAERDLGGTVHVLDDGFQHLRAGARPRPRWSTTPARSRRPRAARAAACASRSTRARARADAGRGRVPRRRGRGRGGRWRCRSRAARSGRCGACRRRDRARSSTPEPDARRPATACWPSPASRSPSAFVDVLRAAGWRVADDVRFRDHHRFTPADCRSHRRGDRGAAAPRPCSPPTRTPCGSTRVGAAAVSAAIACRSTLRVRSGGRAVRLDRRAAASPRGRGGGSSGMRQRLEYWAVVRGVRGAGAAVLPDAVVRAVGQRAGPAPSTRSTARTGAWPSPTSRSASRTAASAERRAIARRMFAHFGQAAARAAALQRAHARADAGARRVRGRRARARGLRAGQGRAVLHRALRLLGTPRDRARRCSCGRSACWRAPLDNPRLHDLLERMRTAHRQHRDLPAGRGAQGAASCCAAGEGVAMLIDQHMHSPDAIWVNFFQRPGGHHVDAGGARAAHGRAGDPRVRAAAARRAVSLRLRAPGRAAGGRRRPTRSASSRSAAPTCSRCTCAGTPSSGCGCTAAGATRRCPRRRACSPRRGMSKKQRMTNNEYRMANERVVVVAPNWLGDAVMALPARGRRCAAHFGGARLAVAARASVAPLFAMVPGVDEVLTLPGAAGLAALGSWRDDAARLAAGRVRHRACCCPTRSSRPLTASRAALPSGGASPPTARARCLTRAVPKARGADASGGLLPGARHGPRRRCRSAARPRDGRSGSRGAAAARRGPCPRRAVRGARARRRVRAGQAVAARTVRGTGGAADRRTRLERRPRGLPRRRSGVRRYRARLPVRPTPGPGRTPDSRLRLPAPDPGSRRCST